MSDQKSENYNQSNEKIYYHIIESLCGKWRLLRQTESEINEIFRRWDFFKKPIDINKK